MRAYHLLVILITTLFLLLFLILSLVGRFFHR
jgi:hypothetical protein